MEKVIHYCWFGGKPLPKLAKKCIKSWEKYLPDYKIIEWNEKNFDINMTKFSKQAYAAKKWAFVSDVARIYALKEFGGIYFDTDMIVTKKIDHLLEDNLFAGWESEFNVAVGVLGVKDKHNPLIEQIWDFYCNNEFSTENVYSLSIPTILTRILKTDYKLKSNHLENQLLKDGVKIYARDYFYPISSDKTPNMFTERTCMIHYYIGSWLSSSDKRRIKFEMLFGKKLGHFILSILVKGKALLKKIIKTIFYPYFVHRRKKYIREFNQKLRDDFDKETLNIKNNDYLAICNSNWLGTSIATKELFNNVIQIPEIYDDKTQEYIANYILNNNFKLLIFSAFAEGWNEIIKKIKLKNSNIIIKVIWHGSNALLSEYYDWKMLDTIFKLYNQNQIDSIGFVKKSLYEFYKSKGFNVEFIYNTVHIDTKKYLYEGSKEDGKIKIGLYSSGNRWVKNFYNQLAAASKFENVKIDCIPIDEKALKMANIFGVPLYGLNNSITREELLRRMAKNDINFYVTFTECAPLTPLESLELGVPCITGNNHHYWEGTELEKYLVVFDVDDCNKIYEKAKYALDNKEEILKLYKKWKKENDEKSQKSIEDFLKIK